MTKGVRALPAARSDSAIFRRAPMTQLRIDPPFICLIGRPDLQKYLSTLALRSGLFQIAQYCFTRFAQQAHSAGRPQIATDAPLLAHGRAARRILVGHVKTYREGKRVANRSASGARIAAVAPRLAHVRAKGTAWQCASTAAPLNSLVFGQKQRAGIEEVISSPSRTPRLASVRRA